MRGNIGRYEIYSRGVPCGRPVPRGRRSIRLTEYDYSQAGAYFVTVCAQERACLFGRVVDGEMRLNEAGEIAKECWMEIPDHFSNVRVDAFVIMPNHMHGIIIIPGAPIVGARHAVPLRTEQFRKPVPGSIPTVMRSYKSAVTKRINEMHGTPARRVWQRNFYEHIIRSEDDMNGIRQYIVLNPAHWHDDDYHPLATTMNPAIVWARHFKEIT